MGNVPSKRDYSLKNILKSALFALLVILFATIVFDFVRIYPKNVHVTNITSSSITVSWVTNFESSGLAKVIGNKNVLPISFFGKEVAFDSRDVKTAELKASELTTENVYESTNFAIKMSDFVDYIGLVEKTKYYVHHVTITGLEPESIYKVMVGDGVLFSSVAKDIKTVAVPNSVLSPLPAYGTIKNANNQDIPVEQLLSVKDAVVYFNYLNEATQAKSNEFSGALNETGNWYIDVSGAVDSNGESFVDKYSQTPTNILAEIVIDGGKLGVWKKVVNANEISPIQTIVLNIPNSVTDGSVEDSLEKIQSNLISDIVSKDVNAGESCIFSAFCGPCVEKVNGVQTQCSCPQSTLDSRKCGGESTKSLEKQMQENASNSGKNCDGGVLGDHVWYGECKECKMNSTNSFALWVGVPSDKCPAGSNGGKVQPVETPVCTGANCVDKDKDDIVMNEGETNRKKCEDPDGCVCMYGSSVTKEIKQYDFCSAGIVSDCTSLSIGTVCQSTQGYGVCEYVSGYSGVKYCKFPSKVTTPIENTTDASCQGKSSGSYCNSEKTKTCQWGGVKLGVSGGQNGNLVCKDKVVTPVVKSDRQECWENSSGDLYKKDGDNQMRCVDGQWEVLPSAETFDCKEGNGCYSARCYDDSGRLLKCSWRNIFVLDTAEEDKTKAAQNVLVKGVGEKCDEAVCICSGGVHKNKLVGEGTVCVGVTVCTKFNEGKSCGVNGICGYIPVKIFEGIASCIESSVSTSDGIKNISLVNKVYADESSVIMDNNVGLLSNLVEGSYLFEYDNETYTFSVDSNDISNKDLTIYVDTNTNGVYDESVDKKISDVASEIKIMALEQKYSYSLKEGYNFISFPFLVSNTDSRTAASLLKTLNDVYDSPIFSISKFEGSWKVVGQNSVLYDNNDFQLIPGQGYVIKASRDINISIVGQPVKFDTTQDSAPILFNLGWNLVGLYGEGVKPYTAESLLDSINSYQKVDFTADNVSKWDTEVQMYEGLQKTYENGTPMVYGFDFPLETQSSYFVRVLQGSGNWNPDVK